VSGPAGGRLIPKSVDRAALVKALASLEALRPTSIRRRVGDQVEDRPLPPITESDRQASLHALLVAGGPKQKQKSKTTDLQVVARRAAALSRALDRLSHGAAAAIPRETLRQWNQQVRIQAAAAAFAASAIAVPSRARKQITGPQRLAMAAAGVFVLVARRRPTRTVRNGRAGSPFIDFLVAVFAARGVRASVENHARWAIQNLHHHIHMEPLRRVSGA
jgi:hypothetical protein